MDSLAPPMLGGLASEGPAFGAGSIVNQGEGEIGTQFGIHKISYDPEGHKTWHPKKVEEEMDKFYQILKNTMGPATPFLEKEEFAIKFWDWAASWDSS